jgi:hypothetical protein
LITALIWPITIFIFEIIEKLKFEVMLILSVPKNDISYTNKVLDFKFAPELENNAISNNIESENTILSTLFDFIKPKFNQLNSLNDIGFVLLLIGVTIFFKRLNIKNKIFASLIIYLLMIHLTGILQNSLWQGRTSIYALILILFLVGNQIEIAKIKKYLKYKRYLYALTFITLIIQISIYRFHINNKYDSDMVQLIMTLNNKRIATLYTNKLQLNIFKEYTIRSFNDLNNQISSNEAIFIDIETYSNSLVYRETIVDGKPVVYFNKNENLEFSIRNNNYTVIKNEKYALITVK